MNLENKRVLITGGGSGIGLELALRLADSNRVVIAGRSTTRLAAAHARDRRLLPVQLDVTSEDSAANVIDCLRSDFGGLDLLVNSAGVMSDDVLTSPTAEATTAEELAVNVEGSIRMTRLALPLLTASPQSGIVFLSSAVALTAVPHFSVYAATKAAVHSFARSLRAELADTNVGVFEVLPPLVDTDLARGLDVPKLPPSKAVDAVMSGLRRNKGQIPVAQVRALPLLARLAPKRADRIVQRALHARATTAESPRNIVPNGRRPP